MSFATLGALASQTSGYTVFNNGNQRGLTFIGYYTGDTPQNIGKNLSPVTVLPLSFTGNKNGGNGSEAFTWSSVGIRQQIPMSKYDKCEVTFTASRAGTLRLARASSAPAIGSGYPTTSTLQEKPFSSGNNTLTFDLSSVDGYPVLEAQISNTATSLTFEITKWRLLKNE